MRRIAARIAAIVLVSLGLIGVSFASSAPQSEAATQALYVSQTCSSGSPGKVHVRLSWQGNDPTAIQQWLDVGIIGPSWGQGTFASVGPFSGSITSFSWDGATSNTVYYVRINQQLSNGALGPKPNVPGCDG